MEKLLNKIALSLLKGVGYSRIKVLAEKIDIHELFLLSPKDIAHETGLTEEAVKQWGIEDAIEIAKQEVELVDKHNIDVRFALDENYPFRLKECHDAPVCIYTKGNIRTNPKKTLAIVGTRRNTYYGRERLEEFFEVFKDKDIEVISGLAYGIDIEAHKLCLKHDMSTLAVLAHGLSEINPVPHSQIAEEMLAYGGLISEFPFYTPADKSFFPRRNRIVAGLADATFVVESAERGGSLITADLAFDYNREVFALPGNVNSTASKGCNKLIKTQKATLAQSASDILTHMGWNSTSNAGIQQKMEFSIGGLEQEILNIINERGTANIDYISLKMNKPVFEVQGLLLTMELEQLIVSRPGNCFSRK